MGKTASFWKKLHRWPGLVVSFVLLYYGLTGILMNHRDLFSRVDFSRDILPSNYRYSHWNNAALKGNLILSRDSILVFGNIGIWCTDSAFRNYTSWNAGFPDGIDNRKVYDIHQTADGNLYTATLTGFYAYNQLSSRWEKIVMPDESARFTGIESVGDTLYVLNRSFLFRGKSAGIHTRFERIELSAPVDYEKRVSLFTTLWQIHSGEIMGLPGKLFVDLLGLVVIFLSLSGILYFFLSNWIKKRIRHETPRGDLPGLNRWSLKWHNRWGAWTFALILILFLTGIFLRPPLLITIAQAEVRPLKYSHLDQPNPWYDKLRDLLFDPERNVLLLSTSDGMYYTDLKKFHPVRFRNQPPVSVMGINTFQPAGEGAFLIGSFSGLFLWHPDDPEVFDFMTGALYEAPKSGRPVGDYKITGILQTPGRNIWIVDYDQGVLTLNDKPAFPEMPEVIRQRSGISLWSVCLEIHTGRFFQNILGDFYILLVPLSGLIGMMVVISGYILWRKSYKKKQKKLTGESI